MTRRFEGRVLRKKRLADDAWEITFDVSSSDFQFTAGQYVTFTLPGLEDLPLSEQIRDFSIVSTPNDLPELSIAFRVSESPYKARLLSLTPGMKVECKGPKGIFHLPETPERTLLFVAGGIGITPFISMIRDASENRQPYRINLYYTTGHSKQAVYLQELREFERQNPLFRPKISSGPLSTEDIAAYAGHHPAVLWYIAGSPGMVDSSRRALETFGILSRYILTESFTGY